MEHLQAPIEEISREAMNKVSEELQDNLNYATFNGAVKQYKDLINNYRTQIEILLETKKEYESNIKKIKSDTKNRKYKTDAETIIESKEVKSKLEETLTRNNISRLSELNNKATNNKLKSDKIQELISLFQDEIKAIEESIDPLDNYVKLLEQSKSPVETIKEEITQLNTKEADIRSKLLKKAVVDNIGGLILLLRTPDDDGLGGQGMGDTTVKKPRVLTEQDLKAYKERSLLSMYNRITLLKNMVNNSSSNNRIKTLKNAYEVYTTKQQQFKLVQIRHADPDEGRFKLVTERIRKYDARYDDVLFPTNKKKDLNIIEKVGQKFGLIDNSIYNDLLFKDTVVNGKKISALENLEAWQQAGGKVVFDNKVYNRIDPKLILATNKNINFTLKEIIVDNFEDFQEIYDQNLKGDIIGFVDLNDWMDTMNDVYSPYQLPNKIDKFFFSLQIMSKNVSKLNAAFLARNIFDSVNQMFSNSIIIPKLIESNRYVNSTLNSLELMKLYEKYSDELSISIINIGLQYEDILKANKLPVKDSNKINNKLNLIKEFLLNYIKISDTLKKNNKHIETRRKVAINLFRKLKESNADNIDKYLDLLKQAVIFTSKTEFGEYIEMYDSRIINNTWVAGLRTDAKNDKGEIIRHKTIADKVDEYEFKKPLLKQLSAFMNTEALNDYLRKDRFELLPKFFEQYRGYKDSYKSGMNYKQIVKELDKVKGGWVSRLNPINWYNSTNTKIENAARITNFFYNLMLYNKTFDQATIDSLNHWFNYGMRSPLETRLLADIPFLSFPVRSINNWIDRLMSPKYWRFLSDFIDGWYAQYREEDKEYNDFTKYQIRQGWIPFSKDWGLRIGNGAFDVMNLIYNTDIEFTKRTSPLLRGIQTLFKGEDTLKAFSQLAVVGFGTRFVNTVTGLSDMVLGTNLREDIARNDPSLARILDTRQTTLFRSISGIGYDIGQFKKYTPRRYRYGRNGRWAKYENIYKDWFNKFGRMRRPTTNPYRLVKNIQWRQYVRYRQSQATILK